MENNRMMDSTKLFWHMDRVIRHFDNNERVAPIHIDWGLSKFCNCRCRFCFGEFQNMKHEYIQKDALLKSVRESAEIGVKSIAFIGDGEPTMNPHLYEALKIGKQSGLSLALSTSGIALDDDEKIETVLDCCEWMRFSLSAGDSEGYKKIHQVNKFDVVVDNIKRIVSIKNSKKYKCDIGLQAVFVPELMKDDMIKEAKLAVDLGVDYFVIKQCSLPVDNKAVGSVQFDVNSYTQDDVINSLKEAEKLSTDHTKIIPKWKTMERKGKREYDHCPAVPLISEISGNGDFFPCGYFFGNKPQYEKYKFGNIHEKSIKEIFESERYWQIIKHFREEFDSSKTCFGSCRLDACNRFISEYLNKPQSVNFI
ncbi:MAG: radical SAM protein [Candidatus Omnitrophica bacterium]|nr:radical SAM protein [Candidatus Omnitrophota bacterium]